MADTRAKVWAKAICSCVSMFFLKKNEERTKWKKKEKEERIKPRGMCNFPGSNGLGGKIEEIQKGDVVNEPNVKRCSIRRRTNDFPNRRK